MGLGEDKAFTALQAWSEDTGASETGVIANGEVETVTVPVTAAPDHGKLFVRVLAQ